MLFLLLLLLLSTLSGIFGSFIIWNNISNYFDSFAHSAVFSVVIGNVLHLNEFTTLIIFAFIFASSFAICVLKRIKLDNNTLIIISSFFIASASLLNSSSNSSIEHHHENCENGMMNLFLGSTLGGIHNLDLSEYLLLSLVLLICCIFFYKSWLKIILNNQLISMQRKDYINYFIFLICVGLFSIVTAKINGILLAIGTSIIPVFVVKNFAKTPLQTIIFAIIFNILISIVSFVICLKTNWNYNGLVIIIEFSIFALLSFVNFKNEKHC